MLMRQGWAWPSETRGGARSAPLVHTGLGVLAAERWEEAHEGMSEEKKKVARQTKKKKMQLPATVGHKGLNLETFSMTTGHTCHSGWLHPY